MDVHTNHKPTYMMDGLLSIHDYNQSISIEKTIFLRNFIKMEHTVLDGEKIFLKSLVMEELKFRTAFTRLTSYLQWNFKPCNKYQALRHHNTNPTINDKRAL